MTHERGQRVYAVFEAALKCNPAVRAAVIENLCAGDPELRAEVERLFARDARAEQDRFMASLASTEQDGPRQDNLPVESPEHYWSRSSDSTSARAPMPAAMPPPGLAEHPDYLVKRELGRGGMGVVYLAENRLLRRKEVLKAMGREIMERPIVLDRFLREIRAVAELRHPNIVTAYHATRLGDSIIFAMEYIDGLDLSRLIKARGPLPVSNACNYIYQAALGLQHAHEQGMVHRDIKPSNLMLTRQGKRAIVKVLDFGLAKVKSEAMVDAELTHKGQLLGTPDYVAPEQTIDASGADIRADIYSLGCTFYYLLTAGPPFQADSLYELLQAHHSAQALPLNLANPTVPVEVATIVAKMMAKQPKRRFQTPKEVAQALKPFFKSGSDRFIAEKPEISHAGQTDHELRALSTELSTSQPPTKRTPAMASSARSANTRSDGSSIGERQTGLGEFEPVDDVAPDDTEAVAGMPRRRWPLLASMVLLTGLLAAWAVSFLMFKNQDGFLIVERWPANAVVTFDGERVDVKRTAGDAAKAQLPPGKRFVVVRLGEETLVAQWVEIKSGKATKLRAKAPRAAQAAPATVVEAPSRELVSPGLVASVPPSATEIRKELSVAPEQKQSAPAPNLEQPTSRPPDDGFVLLFNGQDLTGWNDSPARSSTWALEDGMIVGRGPRRGHLYTANDNFTNFQARIEARINGEGNAGFCFRVPSFLDGDRRGSGYEVVIDANGSNTKTGSLLGFPKQAQLRVVPITANEWFQLEVIALGHKVVVQVNQQVTFDIYDPASRYLRGHFAFHQNGAPTVVRFRGLEVRGLDLGNDPAELAAGGRPRSFDAHAINGKQHVVFPEVLSWEDARKRCTRLGGRLAFPINEEENRFLTKLAKAKGIESVWLGASDVYLEGHFLAVDGSELRYANWGGPDLIGTIDERSKQHYPLLVVNRDGKWSYQPKISTQYSPGFICQWE